MYLCLGYGFCFLDIQNQDDYLVYFSLSGNKDDEIEMIFPYINLFMYIKVLMHPFIPILILTLIRKKENRTKKDIFCFYRDWCGTFGIFNLMLKVEARVVIYMNQYCLRTEVNINIK